MYVCVCVDFVCAQRNEKPSWIMYTVAFSNCKHSSWRPIKPATADAISRQLPRPPTIRPHMHILIVVHGIHNASHTL